MQRSQLSRPRRLCGGIIKNWFGSCLHQKRGCLAGILALALIPASAHAATTATNILTTGFESTETPSYTLGTSLSGYNGWIQSGTGRGVVSNLSPETGSQDLLLTPAAASTSSTFFYQNLGTPVAAAQAAGQTTITSKVSLAMTNPASGSVTTAEFVGFEIYSANLASDLAYMVLEYDPNYKTDGFPSAFTLTALYNNGSGGFPGQIYSLPQFGNTFTGGANQYLDLSIVYDTANKLLSFTSEGQVLYTAPTTFNTFSSAVILDDPLASTGTAPRNLIDNYSVTTSAPAEPAPEPGAGLVLLPIASMMLMLRRRTAVVGQA